jgi:hypothetical protein
MFLLKPARTPEHLLRINASQAVTPIHAERVRKLVPLSNDASVNLNPFCYLLQKVQPYVHQQHVQCFYLRGTFTGSAISSRQGNFQQLDNESAIISLGS